MAVPDGLRWFQLVHPLVLQNILSLFLKNSSSNHQRAGMVTHLTKSWFFCEPFSKLKDSRHYTNLINFTVF